MQFDIDAYLQRMGYYGDRSPTLETLRALHRAHLLSVPFENLNIGLGWPILTTEDALFQKIVVGRRGGFCYELNGLFAALLRVLGFDVTLLSARVVNGAGEVGPEFDHLTLLVQLEECWLADVGFGDSFIEPLRLHEPEAQVQESGAYRVMHDGETSIFATGLYLDTYRAVGPDLKFAKRVAVCDSSRIDTLMALPL